MLERAWRKRNPLALLVGMQVDTTMENSMKVKVKSLSVQLFVTPWTVAYQAPPSMGFSRQECWSGLPFPSLGDLPNPGIEPRSPAFQADALTSEPPGKPPVLHYLQLNISLGEGNGTPLQYSCLENPMDGGPW